ncbi:HAD family hydrolase [Microbacterium sp. LWO12-1.2]|uniref:HAD family hydrolase n=1 Tax=Microbacterium sp. LWO12-1.2 TaxID=3135261 RepID=UPI0034431D0C
MEDGLRRGLRTLEHIEPPYTDADYFDFVDGKKRYDGVASLLHSRNIECRGVRSRIRPKPRPSAASAIARTPPSRHPSAATGIAPFPGSLALIESLRAAGLPLGVVSSSKNAEEVLAAAGIRDFFTVVVDGSSPSGTAWHPSPPLTCFARARVLSVSTRQRAVAVEDATSGAASAAAAGFATSSASTGERAADALRAAGANLYRRRPRPAHHRTHGGPP